MSSYQAEEMHNLEIAHSDSVFLFQTTIIIGNVGNTECDTLCLSRPYAQLTHFGVSDFGLSF